MECAKLATMSVPRATLNYMDPNSTQTLREGIAEYYSANPFLLDPEGMSPAAKALFKQHDAGHVVFGCDTSLRGETLIDTWTILGSTAGIKGYVEYFRHPQIYQIFADVGYWHMTVEFIRCLPDVLRVLIRSRRLESRWPWDRYAEYLDNSLAEIRSRFNIRVVQE